MIGPLVGVHHVVDAVESTLKTWLPSTLTEVAAADGAGPLPAPVRWELVDSLQQLTNTQTPLVATVIEGMADPPRRRGDGTYVVRWNVGAVAVVRAGSQRATQQLLGRYTTAIRVALAQHPDLGGFAKSLELGAEDYDALNSSRTIGAGAVPVTVTVDNVLNDTAGPLQPPDDPTVLHPAPPIITSVTVDQEPS